MPLDVPTTPVRLVLEECRARGLDADALWREAGGPGVDPAAPDARLPFHVEAEVWRLALQATADPGLALAAAARVQPGDYAVLGYLGAHSRTLGEAVRRVARWFALVNRDVVLGVTEDGPRPALTFAVPALGPSVPRAAVDYTLAVTQLRLQQSTGLPVAPCAVDLAYPAPDDDRAERFFGCPVRHGAPDSRLEFAPELWSRPVPGADAARAAGVEQHAALQRDPRPPDDDLVARVRTAVASALPDGAPSLDALARSLGLSGRSLQRHLAARGLGFAEIVETVRDQLAREHLGRADRALSEVAFLLGYSEQSAFTRAFKRRNGLTPGAWRRSLRAP
jgi:AraC-like DNA-binding protein